SRMQILVTGGAGYIGTPLCLRLLELGHGVTCWDPGLFGFHFPSPLPGLDLRARRVQDMSAQDFEQIAPQWVLHLSGLSNDPMANFAPQMNWEENTRASEHVGALAKKFDVPLVFASSASVYGYQPDAILTEDCDVSPIGHYSESKAAAERWLSDHVPRVFCLRQATVMGWSPRMRFDLLTNGMTLSAFSQGRIQVLYGGREARPQVHVLDLVEAYVRVLSTPRLATGVYNVSSSNDNVMGLAQVIQSQLKQQYGRCIELAVTDEARKHRSYNLSSQRLTDATGWRATRSVADTVDELCIRLSEPDFDPHDPRMLNIAWMKLLFDAQSILDRAGRIDTTDRGQ
nr:SDR family oxidoreductase [Polyangiaceae bacterium]